MHPKNRSLNTYLLISAVLCSALIIVPFSDQATGAPIDISDTPLSSQLSAAPPNVMFGLDDSGSMDWEIMTDEDVGLFEIGGTDHEYVFDDPGDNLYTSGTNSQIITGDDRLYWKSQYYDYNVIYYNPEIDYEPWQGYPDADINNPRSHPHYADHYFSLNDTYTSVSQTIVDNEDGAGPPGFTTTGTWQESTRAPEHDGSAYYTNNIGDTATFTPDIAQAGTYQVYAWWNCYNDRDGNAKITIAYNGGTDIVFKNQRSALEDVPEDGICGEWILLGTYDFAAGTSGYVKIERHAASTGSSTVADAIKFAAVDIINAHYYVWSDTDNKPYLVVLDGDIKYYEFTDDGDDKVEPGELSLDATPPADVQSGRTYAEERQNFANWYSFCRKRRTIAVAAIAEVIPRLQGVMVGFRSVNGHIIQSVLPVNVGGQDQTATLLGLLFSYHQGTHTTGSTPLRKGLEKIGRYYHMTETISPAEAELATSPLSADANGQCQQNFAIMFTDAAYNGNAPGPSNVDKDYPAPYGDNASGTLADVAMYYWENDLAPTVANNVPTNFYDSAIWQHMVTYTVTFGVEGNLDPDDYDLYNIDPGQRVYPTWPSPINDDKERLDDMWHAAVNGRGKYFSAKNPQELVKAFDEIINDVLSRIGSGASVSINGEELSSESILYQSSYATDGWTGDVIAYNINPATGQALRDTPRWSASEKLDSAQVSDANYWNTGRIIATYTGSTGTPFRWGDLSAGQQAILTAAQVDYLRGNHVLEEKNTGGFRDRELSVNGVFVRDTMLADVVHSAPLYHNGVLYAGGNDGMLHAFDADNGKELFAYVPNLVFDNLPHLTDPAYTHKYYVDLTVYVKDTGSETLLVGGFQKGGKGYYCLDVTDLDGSDSDPLSITTEAQLAGKVKWEYPRTGTPAADVDDMGFSFSRAFVVNTNAGWVVIFGNGYNSTNENAVLFVLNAADGTLLKKIDVGAGPSNGLSTPIVVDVNADYIVDYVYAGDLQGNLWKFDITAALAANWEVAYNDGTDKPLFQAKDDSGNPQPITTKPDVMRSCDHTKSGYMVIFGTGKYLGATDLLDTNTQTIYGIWDYGDDSDNDEYLGSFDRGSTPVLSNQPNLVTLLEQDEIYYDTVNGVYLRVLSDKEPVWETIDDADAGEEPDPSNTTANHAGWYFDLTINKERVVRQLMIRGDKVIAVTSIPQTASPCSAGGESVLLQMDACTGGRMVEAQFDINDDGKIDENDLIEVTIGGVTVKVAPTGIHYSSMIHPPVILRAHGIEILLISDEDANIRYEASAPERRGIFYWRSN